MQDDSKNRARPLAAKREKGNTPIMNKLLFIIIGILCLCMTGISQSDVDKIIRLKCDFANSEPVKMSDLISEIKYIPLETNPDCDIGYMNIPVFGKDIIIRSYSGSINGAAGTYRFSSEGKYLNKIGNIGRGPEEYQDNCDVVLIEDTVFVISNFSNNILCYSLSGTFLNKYHININARPKSIVQLPDKSFMISLSNPSENGTLLKADRDYNIKTGYIKNIPFQDNPLPKGFQRSKEKIFYFYNYFDTIFEISKGYPIPSIVIDYGKYKTSNEKLSADKKDNVILNKPRITDFSSCDNYLHLCAYYPFKNATYSTLYRISDGKQVTWTKLINDIDNGTLDRWSGFLAENTLIFHLMPSTIKARFEKMTDAEKLDPKNSGFVNMASKISSGSNPVLMICKLK